jgi:multidrug efflux pump
MYLLNYSLDNLSLMALTVATGFVVDDAIVVIENITRYLEEGLSPLNAALKGAAEIGFTVVSISVSLVAVFIPILLMGGYVGRLFREFAVTLSVAIGVSMVVSLTTTPMMCAVLLKDRRNVRHNWFYRITESGFDLIHRFYERTLTLVLRHPLATLVATLATVGMTVYLYTVVPMSLFPQQDTGRLSANLQADQDTSYDTMVRLLTQFSGVVSSDPAVDAVVASIGGGGTGNTGRMFVSLKPLSERKMSSDQVIARLRGKLSHIPGATLILQAVQDVRAGARPSRAQYQYALQGETLDELNQWAPRIEAKLHDIPGVVDVNSDLQARGLQTNLIIDRVTAARLNVSTQAIDDALYDAFGQRQVSTMYKALNQYHVVMEASPMFTQGPLNLEHVYVRTGTGTVVPLSTVAKFEQAPAPLSINHQSQFPCITLSFNLKQGTSLGQAENLIEEAVRAMGVPSTIHGSFAGTAQVFQQSLASQPYLIAAALVAVYLVLGMLYESFIHPITILSTLPSAGVGALLALLLFRIDLSVIALIGIILLIGIVKKNAIMMIDFAIAAERAQEMSPKEAIFKAAVLRFRPITMTTMAAMLGGLPLAIGAGVGGELRQPLGITIVGGLIFSQAMTLYTTPVIYLYLDELRIFLGRFRRWFMRSLRAALGRPRRPEIQS